jgi:predicted nucleic acid-binding protein
MTDVVPPHYWDSNLFLSYVEGTPGRVATVRSLVVRASPDSIRISTSMVTVSEVAFSGRERATGVLSPSFDRAITRLWADPVIELVAVSFDIVMTARDLIRGALLDGPRLKPMDAIHLATARSADASVFLTYDQALQRHSGRHGFPIIEP